jgi:PadR family transcriptional regulator PadR
MDIAPWHAQLRKGAAELVVLSVLAGGESYGLRILELANRAGEIVTEGALYPLLARLEKEAKLASRWVTDDGPHPRKYYRLTADGAAARGEMARAWTTFRLAMSQVVEEDR